MATKKEHPNKLFETTANLIEILGQCIALINAMARRTDIEPLKKFIVEYRSGKRAVYDYEKGEIEFSGPRPRKKGPRMQVSSHQPNNNQQNGQ